MTFAVVFPGQGSQSVGMLAELAKWSEDVRTTFDEAADYLSEDLWQIAQTGPMDVLNDTRVTQPLMYVAGVAVWRALRKAGLPMPVAIAGHSLGEFVAMVAAGVMSYRDGLKLVQQRAQLMASAIPEGEGGMAALIGMEDDAVIRLCEANTGERVCEAVNFNAPGQVVISGHLDALQKTVAVAKDHGCKRALMLAVSVPNHSTLMRPAGVALARTIDSMSFNRPTVPMLQNVTAAAPDDADQMLEHLKVHVHSPVYWTKTIMRLRDHHKASLLIEAGPGNVLTGLSKRIDRALPTLPVGSPETLQAAVAAAVNTLQEAELS